MERCKVEIKKYKRKWNQWGEKLPYYADCIGNYCFVATVPGCGSYYFDLFCYYVKYLRGWRGTLGLCFKIISIQSFSDCCGCDPIVFIIASRTLSLCSDVC